MIGVHESSLECLNCGYCIYLNTMCTLYSHIGFTHFTPDDQKGLAESSY